MMLCYEEIGFEGIWGQHLNTQAWDKWALVWVECGKNEKPINDKGSYKVNKQIEEWLWFSKIKLQS